MATNEPESEPTSYFNRIAAAATPSWQMSWIKKPYLLWLAAALLGWGFDFCFWGADDLGINFLIYLAAGLTAGMLLLRGLGISPARRALLLLPAVLFFAAMPVLRLEPLTSILSWLAALLLAMVLAVSYQGGRWPAYRIIDYVVKLAALIASAYARGLVFFLEAVKRQPRGGAKQRLRQAGPVLRGVAIALPILVVFAALLASADLIFADRIQGLADLISFDRLPEYISRLFQILIVAYLWSGILLHAAAERREEKLAPHSNLLRPFLGLTEPVIVLGSVMVLFIAFVIVQFQHFFGGQSSIDLAGYTYAEYARRGFGELIAVAVGSLLLLLALGKFTRRQDRRQQTVFSLLSAGVVALQLVILVSAFQRLMLYEDAYGFSRLRTYTHVFMIWLGLLLVAFVVLEIAQRPRSFLLAAILAAAGFTASMGLLNIDGFIAGKNVERSLGGAELDSRYLKELSLDAVPALAQAYRAESTPQPLRDQLGGVLDSFAAEVDKGRDRSWKSFTLSQNKAESALGEAGKS